MLPSLPLALTSISLLAMQAVTPAWVPNEKLLASHEISLESRFPVSSVNTVMKDNILLNLAYLDGRVESKADIDWDYLRSPYMFEFRLNPGETFSYHEGVYQEYSGRISKTTNAHFNGLEGFKSDGYLMGDGVCHLASLINWSAQDAGLLVQAPVNHNFANIPEIPREYGTSIYYHPSRAYSNQKQNLYVTNNLEKQVIFRFQYIDNQLTVSVLEAK